VRSVSGRIFNDAVDVVLSADAAIIAKPGKPRYSLLETCKANGLDTCAYLVALFKALPYARTVDDFEAPGAAAALYGRARLAGRILPLANQVVANFPGPTVPLCLAGARLLTWWPLSIVEHGLGLDVTVQSGAGSPDFGVVAARSAMRDPSAFVGAMREAFAELAALPRRPPGSG